MTFVPLLTSLQASVLLSRNPSSFQPKVTFDKLALTLYARLFPSLLLPTND